MNSKTCNPQPATRNPKTVYPISLGCPKNLVDTEIMLGHLTREGWEVAASPEAASLLLVNTCAFIASASQEAVDTILELARHKEADPGKRLAVAGCLVQRYGRDLPSQLPEVDYFIGVNDFPRLPRIIEGFPIPEEPCLFQGAPLFDYAQPQPRYPATRRAFAYLKIAEGCSHRCTYCTIPGIRGPLRSRPLATLLAEAEVLAASGVKELNLVAQDTTAYGLDKKDAPGLPELLRELGKIQGIDWIRLLYGHPARITRELLETMAAHPRICPYLDLPIQHGHDEMLRRMGRGYTRQDILSACRLIREFIPHAALRTTVMAGFPGETEEHFAALFDLIQEVGFEHLGVFLYSPEEGTPAARFAPPVPRRIARQRAGKIKALQAQIVKERLKSLKGAIQPVLVEGISSESDYLLTGRLITQAPEIDGQVYITGGEARIGEIQPVLIKRALPYDLVGEVQ
ncbi:MAG: 30S ribosomal protein S12 methylthiotransferase RimO [Deltaproteobacteria bacterium]|nr:MAG: 30S ribosomal protein S12 methylthiotransferase RimO [Deltaproteobacteria bacterium]